MCLVYLRISCSVYLNNITGTGEIYLSLPLDFESSTSHTVDILATDGTPLSPNRRSSNALLTVFVTDINDNRPNCGNTLFSVFYPDAATIGYPLIQLNCTDPDQGPSGLSYSLSSEYSNLFNISNDGLLTVANPVSSDVTITVSSLHIIIVCVLVHSNSDFCIGQLHWRFCTSNKYHDNDSVSRSEQLLSSVFSIRLFARLLRKFISGRSCAGYIGTGWRHGG